jgi:hypothetical protein
VNLLRRLLRLYSYAFNALFALVILAMACIILTGKPATVNFYLLPWEGPALLYSLFVLALLGLIILLVAVRGKMPKLFLAWSVLVLLLIVRYYFFTPSSFTPDTGQFTTALWVILAAAVAIAGASVKPTPNHR